MIASRVTQTTQAAGNAAGGGIWATGDNGPGQLGLGGQVYVPEVWTLNQTEQLIDRPTVVSAGWHSLALDARGSVWAWGLPGNGLLGLGIPEIPMGQNTSPSKVVDLGDVIAISAGANHSLALRADGTVWAWGTNFRGQLGDGTLTDRSTPVQTQDISTAIAISAGNGFSLALLADGSLVGWGSNISGQLSYGPTPTNPEPIDLGLDSVAAISAGGGHCLALKANGTVWAWGANNHGQLGVGSTTNPKIPIQVPSIHDAIGISAGGWHSLILRANGRVVAAGRNDRGQVGDGTAIDRHVFVAVTMPPDMHAVEVAAGHRHSLARLVDGGVRAWGFGKSGRLGTGEDGDSYQPEPVLESPDAVDPVNAGQPARRMTSIAAGWAHSLMIREDDIVKTSQVADVLVSSAPWIWGSGDKGQLLGPHFWPESSSAVGFDWGWHEILGVSPSEIPASAIAADASHSVSVDAGSLTYWGGTVANATTFQAPITPLLAKDIVVVAAGPAGMVFLTAGGETWQWDYGYYLPSGPLKGLDGASVTATAVAVGGLHRLVLSPSGTVLAWGSNDRGQLGIGFADVAVHPHVTPVKDLRNVVAVAAGSAHSLALLADGSVWAWGANDLGQLGDGTTTDRAYPVLVQRSGGPLYAKAIAAYGGGDHSLALAPYGTVWAWGMNDAGQLGTGGPLYLTNQTLAAQTTWHSAIGTYRPLSLVKAVAAGRYHSLALLADGHVFGWGDNDDGQLGDGGSDPLYQPYLDHPVTWIAPPDKSGLIQSFTLEAVTAIAAGERHSLALGRNPNFSYVWSQ